MSVQLGVLNEEAITEEDRFFWGHRHRHLTLAAAGNSALKWLNWVRKRRGDRDVPSQLLCCVPGSTKRHHPVKMFCHGCFSAEQEPQCLPFRWARRGGGGGVCFQNGSIVNRDWLVWRCRYGVWGQWLPVRRTGHQVCWECVWVCVNRKADIWTAGSRIHTWLKEN